MPEIPSDFIRLLVEISSRSSWGHPGWSDLDDKC
jgi:hypothetical protein